MSNGFLIRFKIIVSHLIQSPLHFSRVCNVLFQDFRYVLLSLIYGKRQKIQPDKPKLIEQTIGGPDETMFSKKIIYIKYNKPVQDVKSLSIALNGLPAKFEALVLMSHLGFSSSKTFLNQLSFKSKIRVNSLVAKYVSSIKAATTTE